ncbi:MAG: LptA/OstA family protein [Candidatus Aureabacteria bacterium]|nr:LptA/OstA family protein [Candidatus Auribacterota bacterium]
MSVVAAILILILSAPQGEGTARKDTATPDAKRVPTVVTSERLEMDYAKNVAVFTGRVHVKDPSGELWADKMVTTYEPKRRVIRELTATGKKVLILSRGKRSTSKKAVYTERDGRIVLTGDPRILQGRNAYTAEKITIFKDTEKTIFEPRARMVVYSGEGGDAFEEMR